MRLPLVAGTAGLLLIAFTVAAAQLVGRDVADLTREPQTVLLGPSYIGAFSNLGGLLWFATGGILTFAAFFGRRLRGPLAGAAVLTWALGLDDIFLLHDAAYPALGIPEPVVVAGYVMIIALVVWRSHGELQPATLAGIGSALFCWGVSVTLDRFLNASAFNLDQLSEDGLKFVGAAIWATVWIDEARRATYLIRPGSGTGRDDLRKAREITA